MKHLDYLDESNLKRGIYAIMCDGTTYELLWLDPDLTITGGYAKGLGAVPLNELVPAHEIPYRSERDFTKAYALQVGEYA